MSEQKPASVKIDSASATAPLPAEGAAPNGRKSGEKQENPLVNILLNVVVPAAVLSYLSKEEGRFALGPMWALIVAVAIPIGYGIYFFWEFRKLNLFSVLGFASVILTGGLGLLKTSAVWFAVKEALIPFVLGLAVVLSHYKTSKPLVKVFLLNPDLFDVPRIEKRVAEKNAQAPFEKVLKTGTWLLGGSFFLSTLLNFLLWMYLLGGKEGGSTEYMKAIGTGTWMGFLVIGVPAMAILFYAFFRILREIEEVTGLNREELILPR